MINVCVSSDLQNNVVKPESDAAAGMDGRFTFTYSALVLSDSSSVTVSSLSDLTGSTRPDSNQVVTGGWSSSSGDAITPALTGQEPGAEAGARSVGTVDSLYARVSKKGRVATPPNPTAEEKEEEEDATPPLPDRRTQLDG